MIANKKKRRKFIVDAIIGAIFTLFILFFASVVGFGGFIIKEEKQFKNKIYPHVLIDNVNFGGKTKKQIVDYFLNKTAALKKTSIEVIYQNDPIATFSGTNLNLSYNGQASADRAYLIGRSINFFSRLYQELAAVLNWQSFKIESTISYDKTAIQGFIDSASDQYNKPAQNALFKFESGKVVSFRTDADGLQINTDQLLSDIDSSISQLKNNPNNKKVTLSATILKPEITLANSNNFGIEEEIGEGQSSFRDSIPGRIHNIVLAASKFNGVLVSKDQVFSFNDTVGDISSSTGYQQAYIIKDGKTVLGDGGGVCQVSTTLFRAVLNSGLSVVSRTAHAYRVGYYEQDSKPGFDATVFAPYVDFKFKNDTQTNILIETSVDLKNAILYFKFFGKKDGRQITISNISLYDVTPPPSPLYQDDPTLPKGTTKQTDFAAWGGKSSFDYRVNLGSQILSQATFFSSYQPWQAVYLVGTQ